MKTTIFVAITIAALGAVGVTTSITNSAIPVYSQAGSSSGHESPGCSTGGICTFSGHVNARGESGGGQITFDISQPGAPPIKCVGSPGFKLAEGC